jgi:hypothetical protein
MSGVNEGAPHTTGVPAMSGDEQAAAPAESAQDRLTIAEREFNSLVQQRLNMLHELMQERPKVFTKLICDSLLDESVGEEGSPAGLFASARPHDGIGNAKKLYGYLARQLLRMVDDSPTPLPKTGYISFAEWIEHDFDSTSRAWARSHYPGHYTDPSSSRIMERFFRTPTELLSLSVATTLQMVYHGLPPYERLSTGEDYRLCDESSDGCAYMRERGSRYEVVEDCDLPKWASKYYFNAEHLHWHGVFFTNHWDLTADDVAQRRTAFRRHFGIPMSSVRSDQPKDLENGNPAALGLQGYDATVDEQRERIRAFAKNDGVAMYKMLVDARKGTADSGNWFRQHFELQDSRCTRIFHDDLVSLCAVFLGMAPRPEPQGDFESLADYIAREFSFNTEFLRDDHFESLYVDDVVAELLHDPKAQLGDCINRVCELVHEGVPLYRLTTGSFDEIGENDPMHHFIEKLGKYWEIDARSRFPDWFSGLYFRRCDLAMHATYFSEPVESDIQVQAIREAFRKAIGAETAPASANRASPHSSKLMTPLEEVGRRYYAVNFSLADDETWPKQKVVVEWLISTHGLSKREAEAIDIVARPDRLRGK